MWILEELDKRGWQPADLARKAGLSTGSLSNILNGNRKPGPSVCVAIAQALDEPPELVFRKARLLPPLIGPEESQTFDEILDFMKRLTEDEREEVLDYAKRRYERQQRKRGGGDIPTQAIPERVRQPSPVVERILTQGATKEVEPGLKEKLIAALERMTPEQRATEIYRLLERVNFLEAVEARQPESVRSESDQ